MKIKPYKNHICITYRFKFIKDGEKKHNHIKILNQVLLYTLYMYVYICYVCMHTYIAMKQPFIEVCVSFIYIVDLCVSALYSRYVSHLRKQKRLGLACASTQSCQSLYFSHTQSMDADEG